MSNALIVIDMQNDFVTGSLGNKDAQMIVPNVKAKIKEYADRGDRIIFTRDTHGENYLDTPEGKKLPVKHCIKGVCTDICVVSNALILKAKYPEAVISVDASCCAGVTPEKHKAALETMKSCQIDVCGEDK